MLKKFTIFTIIIAIILGIQFTQTKKTYAIFGLGDIVFDVPNTLVNTGTLVIEKVLKGVVVKAADRMLEKMSNDIIGWSNNGFDGKPGFINDYEGLLDGIVSDSLTSSFNTAAQIASQQVNSSNTSAEDELLFCENNAYQEWEDDLDSFTEPLADYYLEDALTECRIAVSTSDSINQHTGCFQTNNTAAENHATNIVTGPSAQFLSDYPTYTSLDSSTQLEWIDDAFLYYEFTYKTGQCNNFLQIDINSGDPAIIAQNNYNLFESGNVISSRNVAETIANFGTEQFNNTEFEQLASGGADLTLALLGSQSRKDDFKNDITAGGWDGILSLTGEGSTDLALTTTAKVLAGNKAEQEKAIKEAALSLPTKLLDKTKCVEWEKDSSGNTTDKCAREIAITPGDVVASQLTGALQSEQDTAKSFGDDLVGALVNSLGRAVSNLTNQGLAKLTNAAVGSFFDNSQTQILTQGSTSGGDYQSQYNVLGIDPSSNGTFTGNGTELVIDNTPGGLITTDGIGGPEDPTAQIIINLEQSLEKNLDFAIEEKSYYDEIRELTVGVVDVIYEFDRCIPGPDYGWENRFNDVVHGGDQGAIKQIARNETRQMVSDPQITIPAGVDMRDQIDQIFSSSQEGESAIKFRRQAVTRAINTLSYIKEEVEASFNIQKQSHNSDLVLFKSDWEELTATQQASALTYAFENGFYLNPAYTTNGNTVLLTNEVLLNDNERARDAVTQTSWDIWRNETAPSEKLSLRENYYVLQNDLSNSQFVLEARAQLNQLNTNLTNAYEMALDCLSFKAYAIGYDRSQLLPIANDGNVELKNRIAAMAELVNVYNPIAPDDFDFSFGAGVFTNDIPTFNVEDARADAALKSFLESERSLQESGGNALLQTAKMTISSAIQNSILGFTNEEAKQAYFQTYYPDNWITHSHQFVGNRGTIKDIYKYDTLFYIGRRGGAAGWRGTLFCRMPGKFDRWADSDGDDDTSFCFEPWYTGSKLGLQLIVSEINN